MLPDSLVANLDSIGILALWATRPSETQAILRNGFDSDEEKTIHRQLLLYAASVILLRLRRGSKDAKPPGSARLSPDHVLTPAPFANVPGRRIVMKTAPLCCLGLLLIFGTMLAAQTPGPCVGVSGTAYVNWPQFHSDPCHTGYNPSEFILSPATSETWFSIGSTTRGLPSDFPRLRWRMGWSMSAPTTTTSMR